MQDIQGDLVRRLLTGRTFNQRDHPIQERRALRRRDPDPDPIGNDQRAAGDGRTVAAAFANHRRGFARDGCLVHRRDPFDHVAVAGNELARGHQHNVAGLQRGGRNRVQRTVRSHDFCAGLGLRLAQARGLRFAPAFGDRFGEICEQNREPQPEIDLERKSEVVGADDEIANEENCRQCGDDFHREHHRIAPHDARVQLSESIADGGHEDLAIGQGLPKSSLAESCRRRWAVMRGRPWFNLRKAGRHSSRNVPRPGPKRVRGNK